LIIFSYWSLFAVILINLNSGLFDDGDSLKKEKSNKKVKRAYLIDSLFIFLHV